MALGASGLLGATGLPAVAADKSRVTADLVRLDAGIEPLVRLLERTPRTQCVGMLAGQVRQGVPYRQLLAALFLAGIRNVNPQPPGYKFHCVFVIHAAHQLSLDLPADQRLLPLFWALDNFKVSQAKDIEEGDFNLAAVRGRLPAPEKAWDEFRAAMADWDEQRADRAIVALVRSRGAHEIIEGLWEYGARDYRNIGHKPIFVANTWRTLQTIGWQHAEPALRSLVLGLLDYGKAERVNKFAFTDQVFLGNRRFVDAVMPPGSQRSSSRWPANWSRPGSQVSRVSGLVEAMRSLDPHACCRLVGERLGKGEFRAQAAWDAVHLMAGELMIRQPGIYGIHTVTSANALHTAYQLAALPATRLLLLLQAVGWMVQFREFMATTRGGLNKSDILVRPPGRQVKPRPDDSRSAIEAVLGAIGQDAGTAAAAARGLGELAAASKQPALLGDFASAVRQLIARKATDAHHYKYGMAIFENLDRVSPAFRPHVLAAAPYFLRGRKDPDTPVVTRALDALGAG
ncbi:MAG: hypothetical protein CMJ45_13915 [Planctomyces sp.]|jgi:hypothetical protein|nr:hypothetical protein [Planctomyces sp.]